MAAVLPFWNTLRSVALITGGTARNQRRGCRRADRRTLHAPLDFDGTKLREFLGLAGSFHPAYNRQYAAVGGRADGESYVPATGLKRRTRIVPRSAFPFPGYGQILRQEDRTMEDCLPPIHLHRSARCAVGINSHAFGAVRA